MNNVVLIGRLGQDPEARFFESGSNLVEFTLAVSKKVKGEDKTVWVPCKAWGKTAEVIANYARKGSQIAVSGEIEQESWDDKQSGQKRSKLLVSVQRVQLLGKKDDGGQEQPGKPVTQTSSEQTKFYGDGEPDYDDIPFMYPLRSNAFARLGLIDCYENQNIW